MAASLPAAASYTTNRDTTQPWAVRSGRSATAADPQHTQSMQDSTPVGPGAYQRRSRDQAGRLARTLTEPLKALENVVLTPHMAALSGAAQAAQQQVLLDNLEAFFAGRSVRSQVPAVPAAP